MSMTTGGGVDQDAIRVANRYAAQITKPDTLLGRAGACRDAAAMYQRDARESAAAAQAHRATARTIGDPDIAAEHERQAQVAEGEARLEILAARHYDMQAGAYEAGADPQAPAAAGAHDGQVTAADIPSGDGASATSSSLWPARSDMTITDVGEPAAAAPHQHEQHQPGTDSGTSPSQAAVDLDEETVRRFDTELDELTQLAADLADRLTAFATHSHGHLDPSITGAASGGRALCQEIADDLADARHQLQSTYAAELGFTGSIDTGGWYLTNDTTGPYLDWSSALPTAAGGAVEMGDGQDAVVIELSGTELQELSGTLAGILDGDPDAGAVIPGSGSDYLIAGALTEGGTCHLTVGDADTSLAIEVTEQQLQVIHTQLCQDIEDAATAWTAS